MNYVYLNYLLLIIGTLITLFARSFIDISYKKYSKIKNESGLKGYEVALKILESHGIKDVKVCKVSGVLSDHYNPSKKVVNLSKLVYEGDTVASVAVAAHECGHVIQHKEGYTFMRIRSFLAPFVSISSYLGYFAILIGLLSGLTNVIWLGIYFECVILLFELITLPVEIDASKRALQELSFIDDSNGSKQMLVAAASTYVASVATTFIEILRLVLILGRKKD